MKPSEFTKIVEETQYDGRIVLELKKGGLSNHHLDFNKQTAQKINKINKKLDKLDE